MKQQDIETLIWCAFGLFFGVLIFRKELGLIE